MGTLSRWVVTILWLAVGCDGDRTSTSEVDNPTGGGTGTTPANREIALADSGLAAAIRVALGQSTGPVTVDQAMILTELNAPGRGIADLRGIGELTNLRVLGLRDNRITDLTPLADLSRLAFLDLENNQVSDLTPLARLDSLQALIADYNRISDPLPLVGLSCLRSVELVGNPIPPVVLRQLQAALNGVHVTGPDTTAAGDTTAGSTTAAAGPTTPLTFLSTRNGYCGIYLVDFDGQRSSATRLLIESNAWTAYTMSWAPGAASLVLPIFFQGHSVPDLCLLSSDGTLTRMNSILRTNGAPAWSPDGQWLALGSEVQGDLELWIMRADGTEPRRLTYSAGNDYPGSWSPDGKRIAFTSARNGDQDIWLIRPDGSDAFPLTDNPSMDWGPVWSPDGQWLAFVSDRDGNFDVWVMKADGTQVRNLSNNPAYEDSPTWSPDGQWLAFVSNRDQGDWEIYVVPAAGGTAINLSNHPGPDLSPCWAPGPVTGFTAPPTTDVVIFADPDLERAVRRTVGAVGRDLTPEDLLTITTLELPHASISDLGGIEGLTNLTTLSLMNYPIFIERDGRLLPDSSNTELPFSGWNQVRDLSPLAGLTKLKRLELGLNPVESLAPLASLTQLTRLTVDPVSTGDLSPLRSLTRMQYLSIYGSEVENLEPLTGMTGLTALYITGGQVRDLTSLTGFTKLILLDLSYNRITHIELLGGLPRLARLNLKQNQIRDIGPLTGLTDLVDLNLIGNPLDQAALDVHLPALRARGVMVGY